MKEQAAPMGVLSQMSVSRMPGFALAVFVLVLAGCATSRNQAPVEDRAVPGRGTMPGATVSPSTVAPALGVAVAVPTDANQAAARCRKCRQARLLHREAGRHADPRRPGDRQNWKDLVKWNNLDNPNVVEVGQVLRVVPPGTDAGAAVRPVVAATKIESRPLDAKPAPVAASGAIAAPTVATSPPATGREPDDDINCSGRLPVASARASTKARARAS